MPGMTDSLENSILNAILRNTSYTSPSNVYLGLLGTAATDSTSGTELTNTGYARQGLTFAAPSAGVAATSASVTWSNSSGSDWDVAVQVGIYDASTGGNLLFYKNIAGRLVKDGESLTIDSGDLTVTLD